MRHFKILKENLFEGTLPSVLIILLLCFVACEQKAIPTAEVDGLMVPEGFTIEEAVPADLLSFPMFASFDGQGRLFVFESTGPNTMGTEAMLEHPSYHIRFLEDRDGDGTFDKSTIFADSIPLPMGGEFHQGSLYIAAPPNLERLTDTNGDGVADEREVILTGWTLNSNAATLSGPFMGPDGWLYLADARRGYEIKRKEGDVVKGKGARIWRCRPDGTGLEVVSGGGFDNSIEVIFTPSGETIGTMTYFMDPEDGQRDALMHWVEGGVYPKPNPVIQEDLLKLTGELMPVMAKFPRVSPSGLMRYRETSFGPEYVGNLFGAEFNTGRIMRHIYKESGATYSAESEPFLTSNSQDSHPTDVLQDADGSLLVVVTGGWFIQGCPLSRVAKPDVPGGIYRIRKKGAPVTKDPRGLAMDFSTMSPEKIAAHLSDPRSAVRDKAVEALVAVGEPAVGALKNVLTTADEEVRTSAVFALFRINTEAALDGVRSALMDDSPMVRTAAARATGLGKDRKAVKKLMELVEMDQPSVRRQAATALGQIGDDQAIEALLTASVDSDDRFVEHAIIHSLITLGNPAPLLQALGHPAVNVKRAAGIALDQMEGRPLEKQHLEQFLASNDAKLRNTGIWLASHHLEWSDVVVDFLKDFFGKPNLSESDVLAVEELMITFSSDANLQRFIADELGRSSTPLPRKLSLMEVIGRSPLQDLPKVWVSQLSKFLKSGESEVQAGVLSLIESRRIPALEQELDQLINNASIPGNFRLQALSARMMSRPMLSASEFHMVVDHLGPEHESPIRQLAVRLLARAELNDAQLMEVANVHIATADLFLLPSLVDAFQGNSNSEVGQALIGALKNKKEGLDNLSEQDLQKLFSTFPPAVQTSAEPLMATLRERHAERLAKLQEVEEHLSKGDVGEGRKIFFGKSACSSCHAVGPEGGKFGPDLTNIGEIRSKHDILEAILYPNASFAREYETFNVATKDNAYVGIISEQFPDAILLTTGPGPGIRIPRSEIVSIEPHNVSMMPPGLDQQLNSEEMADLMAFLEALPYKIERLIEARERE